jgi:hypothetical protein
MTLLQAAGYQLNAFGERGGSPGKARRGIEWEAGAGL